MITGVKDLLKLAGIAVVCFCAVFVCTFMLNFYIDAQSLKPLITEQTQAIFDAQMSTAKFCCAITGGCLSVIAVIMLFFYVKLYVDTHLQQLGLLKAMGYSDGRIALKFWVFGLSVFVGSLLGYGAGYAYMPAVYKGLAVEGLPVIEINFHIIVLLSLVVLPTVILTVFTCLYAVRALKRPVNDMLRGKTKTKNKAVKQRSEKERSFLMTMGLNTLSSKKSLVFFIAFSCFCFSAMVQMSASMQELNTGQMSLLIMIIGVVLALVTMLMAVTSLLNANIKNIAVMKSFGYSMKETVISVLAGYIPFALLGFAVGTVYQFGLLTFMVNVIFKDVASVYTYEFNVKVFFITLAVYIALYTATMALLTLKMSKVPVKVIMQEN